MARLPPAHFAIDIARMYQSYAYASADFASALTSIRASQTVVAIDVSEADLSERHGRTGGRHASRSALAHHVRRKALARHFLHMVLMLPQGFDLGWCQHPHF